jgi:hypothetical protein
LFIRHQYAWIKIKKIDIGSLCVNKLKRGVGVVCVLEGGAREERKKEENY